MKPLNYFKYKTKKILNDGRNSHLCFDCDLFLLEWDFELDLDFERVWERDRPPFLSLLFPDSGRKKPLCSVSSEQLKIPVNNQAQGECTTYSARGLLSVHPPPVQLAFRNIQESHCINSLSAAPCSSTYKPDDYKQLFVIFCCCHNVRL